MQNKLIPNLWFNGTADEAAKFYCSVFKTAKIIDTTRYVEGSHMPVGTVLTVELEIEGQRLVFINAGNEFQLSPAISLAVTVEDQAELDALWSQLSAKPDHEMCGWLQDKFGLSWQIVPRRLQQLVKDKDPAKAARVTQAMLKMKKLDIAALEAAARAA
jgi:predicted 3-demethylubiquinone-9 3-methyltransferase (glyoxalase superfamily)